LQCFQQNKRGWSTRTEQRKEGGQWHEENAGQVHEEKDGCPQDWPATGPGSVDGNQPLGVGLGNAPEEINRLLWQTHGVGDGRIAAFGIVGTTEGIRA
jgi:hypothetical protein